LVESTSSPCSGRLKTTGPGDSSTSALTGPVKKMAGGPVNSSVTFSWG
jgi:hypothetical protein